LFVLDSLIAGKPVTATLAFPPSSGCLTVCQGTGINDLIFKASTTGTAHFPPQKSGSIPLIVPLYIVLSGLNRQYITLSLVMQGFFEKKTIFFQNFWNFQIFWEKTGILTKIRLSSPLK
jgi:hypothetical protein